MALGFALTCTFPYFWRPDLIGICFAFGKVRNAAKCVFAFSVFCFPWIAEVKQKLLIWSSKEINGTSKIYNLAICLQSEKEFVLKELDYTFACISATLRLWIFWFCHILLIVVSFVIWAQLDIWDFPEISFSDFRKALSSNYLLKAP